MACLRRIFSNAKLRLVPPSCPAFRYRTGLAALAASSPQTSPATPSTKRKSITNAPNLREFLSAAGPEIEPPETPIIPYLPEAASKKYGTGRKVYFDVYGCQMNVNDTEIVWSILKGDGFARAEGPEEADVVLLMTCAIRESAEEKIWHRLKQLGALRRKRKKTQPKMRIGLLGCMAERLKEKVLVKERCVDVIAGPDSYRDLPRLLALTENNQKAVNVMLSLDETYADVSPVRLNENFVTAYVSIMRGCDNMCTYCIVPFTRGRERSRPVSSILREVEALSKQGVKEVTLLGQNVNSYRDVSSDPSIEKKATNLAKGFKTVYKNKVGGLRFADLLERVADVDPEMRIRFTSPHPKDFPDEVLEVIKSRNNVCKSLHLPAQSGNSNVLERMRRGYTREAYLELVSRIRSLLPDVAISSDFICGFCGETEEEFADTLSLIDTVKYDVAYLFKYSMREKTTAHRRFQDDVPPPVKKSRLEEMNGVFRRHALEVNSRRIGEKQLILVEGPSKRSDSCLFGRNDGNVKVIFPDREVPRAKDGVLQKIKAGDYVLVEITGATSQTLRGEPVCQTGLVEYYRSLA